MDSKKLTAKQREAFYALIVNSAAYHIVSFCAKEVDEYGISKCLQMGLQSIKKALGDASYLFDGNSTFGVEGINTMIKADAKVPEVSAASILAKVTRDREIVEQAKVYPNYGFEKHKGYGTKAHIAALVQYGRCALHRQTFRVKGLDEPQLFY
jgi:ribonuclease HII